MDSMRVAEHASQVTEHAAVSRRSLLQWRPGYGTLALPAAIYLLVTFVYPVSLLLVRSFSYPTWGLHNFRVLLEQPVYLRVLLNTAVISATVTIACLVLGYPMAYVMSQARPLLQQVLVFVVLIPFWTSILVRSYAWLVILQRKGLLNSLLVGIGILSEPATLVHNRIGVHIGMVQILLPFMIFPLFSVMGRIDNRYVQAAANLGASPSRAFLRVFLPLSMPGVVAGSLLVFILSLGYYITPALLGGPRDIMIAQLIQQQVGDLGNWGLAAALALILLVVTGALALVISRLVKLENVWGQ